jgi:hypothetical protein
MNSHWDNYLCRYNDFVYSLGQTQIGAVVQSEFLDDFPKKVPHPLKRDLVKALIAINQFASDELEDEPADSDDSTVGSDEDRQGFTMMLMMVYGGAASRNDSELKIDFANSIQTQALAMVIAHLEAFFADSVRTICRVRPDVMKCDKKVDWRTLLELNGWPETQNYLIEEYVFNFGWGSIKDSVVSARETLGIDLNNIDDAILEEIHTAEQIRNIAMHNGGRASAEYLKRTGREDLSLGDVVPVTDSMIGGVASNALLVASELCLDIGSVHFGKKRGEIKGVWNRNPNAT